MRPAALAQRRYNKIDCFFGEIMKSVQESVSDQHRGLIPTSEHVQETRTGHKPLGASWGRTTPGSHPDELNPAGCKGTRA